MTEDEILQSVTEALAPYTDACTAEEFAQARVALSNHLERLGVSPFAVRLVPDINYGLMMSEAIAQAKEENAARLGLTAQQQKERREVEAAADRGAVAPTRADLAAAQTVVDGWLLRFPGEASGGAWRAGLAARQIYFDVLDEIAADEAEAARAAAPKVLAGV